MGAGDVEGDGEAQARSRFVEIAGIVEADEGAEGIRPLVRRDAGAVVIDQQRQHVVRDPGRHLHGFRRSARHCR